jgi:hypothetical protein
MMIAVPEMISVKLVIIVEIKRRQNLRRWSVDKCLSRRGCHCDDQLVCVVQFRQEGFLHQQTQAQAKVRNPYKFQNKEKFLRRRKTDGETRHPQHIEPDI